MSVFASRLGLPLGMRVPQVPRVSDLSVGGWVLAQSSFLRGLSGGWTVLPQASGAAGSPFVARGVGQFGVSSLYFKNDVPGHEVLVVGPRVRLFGRPVRVSASGMTRGVEPGYRESDGLSVQVQFFDAAGVGVDSVDPPFSFARGTHGWERKSGVFHPVDATAKFARVYLGLLQTVGEGWIDNVTVNPVLVERA